jgi:3-oxoacyl-[acyl-carrier protein] reductase
MMAGDFSLAGRTVVIAGGSGGIGAATAARFAHVGARIFLGYRKNREAADRILAGLAGEGHAALPLDVTDSASITAFRDRVAEAKDRIDVLVNAAGSTTPVPHGDLEGLTDAIIDEVFASNWRGVFATIRAFAPMLKASGDGVILNVSSIAAFAGVGSSIAYCGAKAGLDAMTHTLAKALAPEVRVLSISPGVVDTGFVPGRTREDIERMSAATPLGRVVGPEDVAEAIFASAVHLRRTTGVRIPVDGGRSL